MAAPDKTEDQTNTSEPTTGLRGAYVGVGGLAKPITKIYVGVGGVAKEVKLAYVGVHVDTLPP